jgi:hypothetical protein
MKLRNAVGAVVVAWGLAVTGTAGSGAAQAVTPASTAAAGSVRPGVKAAEPSLQQLLDTATDEVRATFPNATLVLADGSSPNGPTQDMRQVTDWRLVYNTDDLASRTKRLEFHAALQGEIGQPIDYTGPWEGVLPISDWIGMTPEEAYSVLRDAGHGGAYQYISLLKPLAPLMHLQYHFSNVRGGCDGYAVNVDDFVVRPICD